MESPAAIRSYLNIQLCLYPFLDAGIYFNLVPSMLMVRVAFLFVDLRLWWVKAYCPSAKTAEPTGEAEFKQ